MTDNLTMDDVRNLRAPSGHLDCKTCCDHAELFKDLASRIEKQIQSPPRTRKQDSYDLEDDLTVTELRAESEKYRLNAIHFAEEADHLRARIKDFEEDGPPATGNHRWGICVKCGSDIPTDAPPATRDSERLDWMIVNGAIVGNGEVQTGSGLHSHAKYNWYCRTLSSFSEIIGWGDSPREAIDAAMEADKV